MSARSRLNPNLKKTLLKKQDRVVTPSNRNQYIKHLPLLLLSASLYYLVYHLLFNVYPQGIANIPIYNSYAGLLIPFFLSNSLLLSYLFLNSKRGIRLSFLLTIILFLKLQQFIFEYWWFIPLVISFVINEKLSKKTRSSSRKRD